MQEFINLEEELILKLATGLGGGILRTGSTCGALMSGVLALGTKYGRKSIEDKESVNRTIELGSELHRWFEREFGSTRCFDITKSDLRNPEVLESFVSSPEHEECVKLAGKTASFVLEIFQREGAEPSFSKKGGGK